MAFFSKKAPRTVRPGAVHGARRSRSVGTLSSWAFWARAGCRGSTAFATRPWTARSRSRSCVRKLMESSRSAAAFVEEAQDHRPARPPQHSLGLRAGVRGHEVDVLHDEGRGGQVAARDAAAPGQEGHGGHLQRGRDHGARLRRRGLRAHQGHSPLRPEAAERDGGRARPDLPGRLGLSRRKSELPSEADDDNSPFGTPAYMAPIFLSDRLTER